MAPHPNSTNAYVPINSARSARAVILNLIRIQ
jgi:hypothetical protein